MMYNEDIFNSSTIEGMLGVPKRLLRDEEGWALEEFTRFGTHNTTHVDAPWHYNSTIGDERAQTIDELPLSWFHAPGVVLDMTAKADGDPMTAEEAQAAVAAAGHQLRPHDIVLVRTGREPATAASADGAADHIVIDLCEAGRLILESRQSPSPGLTVTKGAKRRE